MSDTLIAALEERRGIAANATPGPWSIDQYREICTDVWQIIGPEVEGENPVVLDCSRVDYEGGGYPPSDDDAAFIIDNDPQTVTLLLDLAIAAERRRQARLAFTREWDVAHWEDDAVRQKRLWEGLEQASNALDVTLLSLQQHLLDATTAQGGAGRTEGAAHE